MCLAGDSQIAFILARGGIKGVEAVLMKGGSIALPLLQPEEAVFSC
jgi:hypothetical protein